MKKMKDIATQTLIIVSLFALAACSSVVSKADRDTSGKYDGRWKLQISPASSPQKVHNWTFSCRDLSTTGRSRLTIKDGQVSLAWRGSLKKTYINEKGVFRLEYPGGKLRVSDTSSTTAVNPNMKILIRGNLDEDKGKGTLVVGFAQVGYAGCTSKVSYDRT